MSLQGSLMKNNLVALAISCCVCGCSLFANESGRRYDYIETRQGSLTPETRAAIIDGKIMRGMTKEEVRASWGDPCWYCRGTRERSWGDVWEYNVFGSGRYSAGSGTYVYFDQAGKVQDWSSP